MFNRVLISGVIAFASLPAFAEGTTAVADIVRGSPVTVTGVVERIDDEDEFTLADATGSIEVYLGPNTVPVTVGETVSVTGFVDDDQGPIDLCASSIIRADGQVIQIANCDG